MQCGWSKSYCHFFTIDLANGCYSLLHAQVVSNVHQQARSRATVMRRIHTAATAMIQTHIRATVPSTGSRPCHSSTACLAALVPLPQLLRPVAPLLRNQLVVMGVPLHTGANVVVRAGLAELFAKAEQLAKLPTNGTPNACRGTCP
jgi:hypothetical protein